MNRASMQHNAPWSLTQIAVKQLVYVEASTSPTPAPAPAAAAPNPPSTAPPSTPQGSEKTSAPPPQPRIASPEEAAELARLKSETTQEWDFYELVGVTDLVRINMMPYAPYEHIAGHAKGRSLPDCEGKDRGAKTDRARPRRKACGGLEHLPQRATATVFSHLSRRTGLNFRHRDVYNIVLKALRFFNTLYTQERTDRVDDCWDFHELTEQLQPSIPMLYSFPAEGIDPKWQV